MSIDQLSRGGVDIHSEGRRHRDAIALLDLDSREAVMADPAPAIERAASEVVARILATLR